MLRVISGTFGPVCEKCAERVVRRCSGQLANQTVAETSGTLVPGGIAQTSIVRLYSSLRVPRNLTHLPNHNQYYVFGANTGRRHIGGLARVVGRFLKVRYLVLTTAVGGGVTITKKYDAWKENLPDTGWIREYIPNADGLEKLGQEIRRFTKNISLPELPKPKKGWQNDLGVPAVPTWDSIKDWLDEATEGDPSLLAEGAGGTALLTKSSSVPDAGNTVTGAGFVPLVGLGTGSGSKEEKGDNKQNRMEKLQQEMIDVQVRYQREIERLEKDNRELKKQLLLKDKKNGKKRKKKKVPTATLR